ncbi:MAG: prepilin-type N-terminal cleavage/methylation domain-containing protein [Desulfuromonadaceae bacterium]|nr:prepilin-type N-terminal cleavage/methylation domain-containing protein [Desulfuromonadaceae bacterium]
MKHFDHKGFTLIEVLVGIMLTAIAGGILFSAFLSQNNTYLTQEQTVEVQQTLRGALELMTREIRMCGFDPARTRLFGIGDVTVGSGGMACTADWQESGDPATGGNEITYEFKNGQLIRSSDGSDKVLAEDIEGMSLAFAFDNDEDGDVDLSANGHVIWAIDSDGDGNLDKSLDTNDDGSIDANDSTAGTALTTPVPLNRIRAVQIWLLARSRIEGKTLVNSRTYVVGNKKIAVSDRFQRRLLVANFVFRNMGI